MADNLKLVEERIDIEIDPTGAPGSILAENHNGIEKEILRKTGKYTGSPFIAKKESTLFPSGTLSWNGNAMNNVSDFLITTSKLTSDLTDFGKLLSTMATGDLIQFKDYSGRTVFLEFQSYVSNIDGSMNPIYEITVKGFADNLNYVYQVNESSVAVLSFIKKIVDLSLLVSKLERLTVPVPNVQNVIELDGENHFVEFQNNGQGFFDYFILGTNYIGGQNHPLQFRNATDSPIVLKNMINSGTSIIGETPLFFPNGLNLILEPHETVQFCYNADNNRFDYVGASFEIEISDVNGLQDELDLKASKTYVDGLVVGLLDDRGNYDASTNLFPSTGGSGTAGALLKGDLWYISVSGTLGGQLVNVGDSIRALTDAPGQTSGNWDILESNIGYVPENTSNKSTDVETDKASNIKFPTVKSVYDWAVAKFQVVLTETVFGTFLNSLSAKSTPVDADSVTIIDTGDSNKAKKTTFTQIKSFLRTYFDTVYQSLLVSGTSIKTINGASILGSGNISVSLITGTINNVQKVASVGALGDSQIIDNGINVGVGRTPTAAKLEVQGGVNVYGDIYAQRDTANMIGFTAWSGNGGFPTIFTSSRKIIISPGIANAFTFMPSGNMLINTATDNGTDKLQVNGSGSFIGEFAKLRLSIDASSYAELYGDGFQKGINFYGNNGVKHLIASADIVGPQTGLPSFTLHNMPSDATKSAILNLKEYATIYRDNTYDLNLRSANAIFMRILGADGYFKTSAHNMVTYAAEEYSFVTRSTKEAGASLIERLTISRNGNIGIYQTVPTTELDVTGTINATKYKISALNTAPAAATSTGTLGEIRITATHIYVCTATNTWVRTALTTW